MTRKSPWGRRPEPPKPIHEHYVITCGLQQCGCQFVICVINKKLPCFITCPACGVHNVFWEE